MNHVHGTYSAGLLTSSKVMAFRDPAGIRPLVLGQRRMWCAFIRKPYA